MYIYIYTHICIYIYIHRERDLITIKLVRRIILLGAGTPVS